MKGKIMKLSVMSVVLMSVFVLAGCGLNAKPQSADAKVAAQTESAMQEALRQVGMPAIVNWKELRDAKMIFELRDQANLVCYAYLQTLNGRLVFFGKCLGYGLPYSVQYTNPERLLTGGYSGNYWATTIPQADPNGLFMPTGLSATWLMMLDQKGKAQPVYVEPQIIVMPFPIETINPAILEK